MTFGVDSTSPGVERTIERKDQRVRPRSLADPWSRGPVWFRRTHILEIATIVIIGLAGGVEIFRITFDGPGWGGYVAMLVALGGTALAWSRPWPGMILIMAGPLVALELGWDPLVAWTIAVFAAFVFTLRGLPGLPIGVLVCVVNFSAAILYDTDGVDFVYAVTAGLPALVAAAAGSAVRGHQRYWNELENRARDAIATREIEVERRVAEERVRIARDLHDVVGHEVAVINMHLGAAEIHLPAAADATRNDLAAARGGVQAVLRETQQILAILRVGMVDDSSSPTAGYGHIRDLVSTFRSAGLAVEATIAEPGGSLSPNVSTAAYRIAQEAMTNAHRHGTGSMTLRVDVFGGVVTIDAENDKGVAGFADAGSHRGYGLVGMRERATTAGGQLDVHDRDDTFGIHAILRSDDTPGAR